MNKIIMMIMSKRYKLLSKKAKLEVKKIKQVNEEIH